MGSTSSPQVRKMAVMDKDLKNNTFRELENIVENFGQKKYLAKYIFTFIHCKGAVDISDISQLSKVFRTELAKQGYYISGLKTVRTLADTDGTKKYLFELGDGNRIETVLLLDGDRKTLCVSTQAGCSMDCAFCATAKLKFQRNLTAAEIADQVNVAEADNGKINNVVYMGMGEPMLNYEAVLKSVRILNNPQGKNIGIRHLTISTCGETKGIRKLAEEDVRPRLAISLNAPIDSLRSKIMPINKKYPIAALLDAVKDYQIKTAERVTFEYVLMKDTNDSSLHAQMLAKLLRYVKCNVNLIEYNPHPYCLFEASDRVAIKRFKQTLEDAGIETIIRFKKGRKIKAACGQLGADMIENKPQDKRGS
ncbi:MAG: 23S rRNA (adenine(2503)-C(2))-methyltransferase RlmN [Phycisphaerae bacterium]|nr:23S rRNA (adenine(2503)-C(2))-methyltransferase RlmN [Phycisphaerae bacterium]